jgi:two-component system sensor histidine kinase AlgZ
MAEKKQEHHSLLPEFCSWWLLFASIVVAQICVLVIELAPGNPPSLSEMSVNTFFAIWLTSLCVATLCVLRRYLARLRDLPAYWLCWLIIQVIAAIVAAVSYWFNESLVLQLVPSTREQQVFTMSVVLITMVVSAAMLRYFYIRQLWQQELLAQTEARVQALQARIRPHFLFNSLNSIASLIMQNPEAAEAATEDLSDLFRGALRKADQTIPLAEELDLVRKYLSMEQIRLGDRLQIQWEIDMLPKDARVPPLLLQPLAENAINHGIQPRHEGGTVKLSGAFDDEFIVIVISNPLPEAGGDTSSNQVALKNIHERLYYHYSGRAVLKAEIHDGNYQAILRIPYVEYHPD